MDTSTITYRYAIGNIVTDVVINIDAYPVSYTIQYFIADRNNKADSSLTDTHANEHSYTDSSLTNSNT